MRILPAPSLDKPAAPRKPAATVSAEPRKG